MIRVLLMDSGYNSYFHPELVLVCNGKETVYTPETVKAEGGVRYCAGMRRWDPDHFYPATER